MDADRHRSSCKGQGNPQDGAARTKAKEGRRQMSGEKRAGGSAQENLIDTNWQLDEQNHLLSRGFLVFRYSGFMKVEGTAWTPTKWEKLLTTGTFVEVTDADQIKELNNALSFRIAILEDLEARQRLTR